ncbi:MAG: DUF2079 domain-containing protein [Candidatus Omnitrophica bacterium]|nr:DUF2079 domain-containing protein [Candidatus Omnitrophota bacterium]
MQKPQKSALNKTDALAFFLTALYVFFFGLVSVLKYNSFSYNDFDLAVHAQTLYNILHGSIESSILGIPFLGNHLNFILFVIAPAYAVFQSPLTLLLLQTLALGASAYPIYLIAKENLPENVSLAVLFSYLFYPSLGYVNLFEFHPTAFATFFISATLYFIYKSRFIPFIIMIILVLLCQENLPLVVVPIGIYLLLIKRPVKWWLSTIILGSVWFWIGVYVLIPYFGKGIIQFTSLYGYLGNTGGEILKNILTHPVQLSNIILNPENHNYLLQIIGPVLFLPLLSPVNFLAAVPTIFQHLLSSRLTEHTIYFHYTAEIIPFVFFASIFGLKKVLSRSTFHKKENFLVNSLLLAAIGSNLILGPHINNLLNLRSFLKTDSDYIKEAFLKEIPRDAEVVSTFEFLPQLSGRSKLYSLHHVIMGKYTLSDISYRLPPTTEYMLIDFEDPLTFKSGFYTKEGDKNFKQLLRDGGFRVVKKAGPIVLFKK